MASANSRMKVSVDVEGPALAIAALNAAVDSTEKYTFPMSEQTYRNVVTGRADFFLEWLQQYNMPRTFAGEGDDPTQT